MHVSGDRENERYNKRFETHSPIVMEFAVPPGGGQTPRQLRLRAQAVVKWTQEIWI
jgi:hypothetical protein